MVDARDGDKEGKVEDMGIAKRKERGNDTGKGCRKKSHKSLRHGTRLSLPDITQPGPAHHFSGGKLAKGRKKGKLKKGG